MLSEEDDVLGAHGESSHLIDPPKTSGCDFDVSERYFEGAPAGEARPMAHQDSVPDAFQSDLWRAEDPAGVRERHTWLPVDLLAVGAAPPEPPTIGGLVYPGRRHVFSGEPESLKSWTAKALTVEEIRAGRAVLYVDFEMGRREMLARLRALGLADDELRERFLFLEPSEPIGTEGVLRDVQDLLATRRPSLVVIDAMTGALTLHGCDPNSGRDVENFYRAVVEQLRAHDAAVVILDHLPKDTTARGRFAIGSERKIAGADVHLRFEVVHPFGRGRTGTAKLLTQKDRPGYLPRPRCAEIEFVSSAAGSISYTITLADSQEGESSPSFRPTTLMERVSRYLEEIAPGTASRNEVEAAVRGRGEYVRLAMDVLHAEGYIVEEAGPRGARLLRSMTSFREAQDHLVPPRPHFVQDEVVPPRPDFVPPLQGDEVEGDEVVQVEQPRLVPLSGDDDLDPLRDSAS